MEAAPQYIQTNQTVELQPVGTDAYGQPVYQQQPIGPDAYGAGQGVYQQQPPPQYATHSY